METSQTPGTSTVAEHKCELAQLELRKQLQDELTEFKAEIAQRPLLYLTIAFIAGFVSCTFPVRLISLVLIRLVSFLLGPAILLIGILKISEFFCETRRVRDARG
jgi:hypothetical protein